MTKFNDYELFIIVNALRRYILWFGEENKDESYIKDIIELRKRIAEENGIEHALREIDFLER